jgi:hypothetical protein
MRKKTWKEQKRAAGRPVETACSEASL